MIVYANKVREAFGDIPLVIGGLEASLRRFAHYDYWEDKVRRAILFDSQADLLVYGMGERATREIAARLASERFFPHPGDYRCKGNHLYCQRSFCVCLSKGGVPFL